MPRCAVGQGDKSHFLALCQRHTDHSEEPEPVHLYRVGRRPFADAENTSLVVENCDQKGTTGVVNGGGLSTKVTGTASVKITGSTLYSVSGGGMSEPVYWMVRPLM